jgi:beta-lactamase superfamily II metal-dependent hydrolase
VSAEVLTTGGDGIAVIRIMLGKSRILILPSADQEMISSLSHVPDDSLQAEVLVLPLGGVELASTMALIARISPRVVISPVSPFKRNGVPSREWDQLLAGKEIVFFRQDETGALIIDSRECNPCVRSFLCPEINIPLR